MDSFAEFASKHGYPDLKPIADSRIHRFRRNGQRRDNCWYVAFPSGYGVIGDWSTEEKLTYRPGGNGNDSLTPSERARLNDAIVKAQEEWRRDRVVQAEEAADRAKRAISFGRDFGISGYMKRKSITKLHGGAKMVLSTEGYDVLVPMYGGAGRLIGLQTIEEDGSKKFTHGMAFKGSYNLIGIPNGRIYLCEGWATAATVHDATGEATAAAFSASNLAEACKTLSDQYPNAEIIVCADADDPGREGALKTGRKMVFPRFAADVEGTDFNDLAVRDGLRAVKEQVVRASTDKKPIEHIETKKVEHKEFISLGFEDDIYYYFNLTTRQLIKTSIFNDVFFLRLMSKNYWEKNYTREGGRKINWFDAKDDVISMAGRAGNFNTKRIRGVGVWFDKDRIIINAGEKVYVDGKPVDYKSINSYYIYVSSGFKINPIHEKPLTTNETLILRRACENLKWRYSKSGYLLAGWLAIARIAGAFPIRPHIWLTGASGTGKSTIMEALINPALGSQDAKVQESGGSTEAGIRQKLKANSLPIIYDEFETNDYRSSERIKNIIELFRQSWSQTQGSITKGSSKGVFTDYLLNFCALVSSIRVNLQDEADRSRFAELELIPHGNSVEHWAKLECLLDEIDEEYGERLFARSISQIKNIYKSFKTFKKALTGVISARGGQQYGMLLAGYYSLVSDEPVTDAIASNVISELDFFDERQEVEMNDSLECFVHLMTTKVSYEQEEIVDSATGNRLFNVRKENTIGQILLEEHPVRVNELSKYGVRILEIDEKKVIIVSTNHNELSKIYAKTKWAGSWSKSLLRIDGAESSKKVQRFKIEDPTKKIKSWPTKFTKIPFATLGILEGISQKDQI